MNRDKSQDSCVVLFSGGMDSTVVLHHALKKHKKVLCLIFDYAQRHSIEIESALSIIVDLQKTFEKELIYKIIPLHLMGDNSSLINFNLDVPKMKDVIGDPQTSTYVPNRNMLFLSLAASFAETIEANVIYYGAAKADNTSGYWDCTQEFRSLMNQILSLNRRNRIHIEAPLIEMSKKEIIEYGQLLGVNFSKTHTCYVGNNSACGECPSCSARIAGFIQAKKIDPINYSKIIDWKKFNCELI